MNESPIVMEEGSSTTERPNESPIAMEEGSNATEYAKRRFKRVTEMNESAGYVEIRNTEANIKATWKNLSSKVKGILGKRKINESKQRWPSLPGR